MAPMNVSRKRTYADFSRAPLMPRFKLFDDLEELYLEIRSWSIVVRVDVKFPMNSYRDEQHFILMDTTGSKIEAIVADENVDRFNNLLTEGGVYTLHGVRFQINWKDALEFRNIGHMYECSFNDRTTVEPYNMPVQFPLFPKHLMSFHEVYHRPNKTFVDIAGIVVHRDSLEHIGPKHYREYILMDMRKNIIVVGVWSEHLTRHLLNWSLAAANNDIVLGTMLRQNKIHGCLQSSDHSSFSFNSDHHATR